MNETKTNAGLLSPEYDTGHPLENLVLCFHYQQKKNNNILHCARAQEQQHKYKRCMLTGIPTGILLQKLVGRFEHCIYSLAGSVVE